MGPSYMSNPLFDVNGFSYTSAFNFAGLINVPTDPKN